MKLSTFFVFGLWMFSNSIVAQSQKGSPPEPLLIGVQYDIYGNKRASWKTDFETLSSKGFQIVNLTGQFWPQIENQEGIYDFRFLDECLETASKQNLKITITIPLFTPPRWALEKFKDGFSQNRDGVAKGSTAKNPISMFYPAFQVCTDKWVEEFAKKYGKDKRVSGWILGLDYGPLVTEFDYSQHVRWPFIQWLGKKYDKIENLNQAWSTLSKGQSYSSFQQINLPTSEESGLIENPAVMFDWKQFVASSGADIIKRYADALRKYKDKNQWITCEFQGWQINGNPFLNMGIDFPSVSYSPASAFPAGYGQEGYRINDPFSLGLPLDQFISKTRKTGISSFQIGAKGQPHPFPGSTRLWMFRSWAAGASFLNFYPYSTGNEPFSNPSGSLVGGHSKSWTPIGTEISNTIKEIISLNSLQKAEKDWPENIRNIKTGILVKRENGWDQTLNKKNEQWNYLLHMAKYYEAFKSLQVPVEFIFEESDFSSYKFILAPSYSMVSNELSEKLIRYAEKGGNLIMSCRFAERDENGNRWNDGKTHPLQKLAGIESRMVDILPSNRAGKISFDGKNYDWNNWAEIVTPEKSTQILAIFGDQFYKNSPAIVRKAHKTGSVTYIGVETDGFQLEKEVLKLAFQKGAGKTPIELPRGLEIYYRNGIWMALNFHSSETRKVPIPSTAKIISGSPELKPCEVLIWIEK